MLDLIYITNFHRGKEKNLAYAFGLARAFSSSLALLPVSRIGDPGRGKIRIWQPPKKRERLGALSTGMNSVRKMMPYPLFIIGQQKQADGAATPDFKIVKQLVKWGFPLLVLPYNYPLNGICNILFVGNFPLLADHPLNHLFAATFLPRAFKLANTELERIHWNKLGCMQDAIHSVSNLSFGQLNTKIQRYGIDLAVFPVTDASLSIDSYASWELRTLISCECPVLLIPKSNISPAIQAVETNSFSVSIAFE